MQRTTHYQDETCSVDPQNSISLPDNSKWPELQQLYTPFCLKFALQILNNIFRFPSDNTIILTFSIMEVTNKSFPNSF